MNFLGDWYVNRIEYRKCINPGGRMLTVLNGAMVLFSGFGIAWYATSSVAFQPVLGFFITAGLNGLLGIWALRSSHPKVWFAYSAFTVFSLLVFAMLLALAFVISPGTGAGVGPIICAAIAVCFLTLTEIRNR